MKTAGPNGSIRNKEEYSHGANAGLKIALDFCEEVKSKCPKITYADLYQLAGVVAVEVTGGPTVDFVPGSKDSKVSPNEGRLPDANQGILLCQLSLCCLASLHFPPSLPPNIMGHCASYCSRQNVK
ncbi:L-ascorbate peroxidase 3-like [Syzygium oleosum]|uniref:L-ascorbate peroxidase 3-like n=1 Tax=Syzygium oleosum TaxID=219896 RepID=UPI0011D1D41F|nr:L-ascorbate peroxidase 3-like [Syzygium oleosum]